MQVQAHSANQSFLKGKKTLIPLLNFEFISMRIVVTFLNLTRQRSKK